MGALAGDLLRLALGIDVPFSWALWVLVSVLWIVVAPPFVAAAPRVIDPVAALVVARPERVAVWMPGSILATFGVVLFLAITIVGIPLTVLVAVSVPIVIGLGYIAVSLVLGDVVARRLGRELPPWLAVVVGIAILRIVRAIPFIGAAAQSLAMWIGYAATVSLMWAAALSWHRRRMPDVVQFDGETLVEWYPDGDPEDGRPSVGTGRPVVANIRGEEDRRPSILDEPDEDGESTGEDEEPASHSVQPEQQLPSDPQHQRPPPGSGPGAWYQP